MVDALSLQRIAHALYRRGHFLSARAVTRICRHLFACHLPPEVEIGAGTELGYGGIGVIVHCRAKIGRDVLLSPGVVLGGRSELEGAPVIGDRVKIGAGAKILGPIQIGDGAHVGANAVVIHDVAAGAVVAGVPARPVEKKLKVVDGAG